MNTRSMEVNVLNRKLIKPCTPTPESLRRYNLSLHDELSTPMNGPIVLYYPSIVEKTTRFDTTIFHKLEDSLARILPHFYPFSGRYIKKDLLVDCSDQGVEFVEAEASGDFQLLDVIEIQDPPNDLLPRGSIVPEDEHLGGPFYPLLSIQVTGFNCGGFAIGVSWSHRIADTSSIATFIAFWANATHSNGPAVDLSPLPNFDSPVLFPGRNTPGASVDHIPDTMDGFVSKRFVFKKEAIMALKQRIPDPRAASKVRVVCAVLAMALIRVHHQNSRAFIIGHSLDLRGRIADPPMPRHSCGNLAASALVPLISAKEAEKLGFKELVYLQRDAIQKAVVEYSEMLARGEAGHSIFVDELVYLNETTAGGDVPVLWFSDMTKFGFYEADFGWGKPVWTSFGTNPLENLVVLLADREGSGVEAWVHLDPESMALFEKDDELLKIVGH